MKPHMPSEGLAVPNRRAEEIRTLAQDCPFRVKHLLRLDVAGTMRRKSYHEHFRYAEERNSPTG